MVEQVDTRDLKSLDRSVIRVRFPSPAFKKIQQGVFEMPEIRKYHFLNGTKKIGTFSIVDGVLQLVFDKRLSIYDVLMMFWPEYQRGIRVFGDNDCREFIDERMIPPGRQNIGEILKRMGLEEYDQLAMFLYFNGRAVQDNFSIKEISN